MIDADDFKLEPVKDIIIEEIIISDDNGPILRITYKTKTTEDKSNGQDYFR